MTTEASKLNDDVPQDDGSSPDVASSGAAEGAPQADGAEEERQGCALETVTKLTKKDAFKMYQHQAKTVANMGTLLFFMIYSAARADWGIFASYFIFATLHALIRSIMDWKYDTAGFQGSAKRSKAAALAALNLAQLRVAYDARGCMAAGAVGMSINMTLMTQALVKLVPMNVVNFTNLFVLLSQSSISETEILAICILLIQIIANAIGVMMQTSNFELMTNTAKAGPVICFIRIYFASDVMVRGLSFGILMFAAVENDNVPSLLAFVPPFLLYLNRTLIMSTLYIQRGYIYPPTAPATTDGTSNCQKIIFAVFPGGFVQLFTDFPFNGDLATKKAYFAVHQVLSLSESVLCVLVAVTVCDFVILLPREWSPYVVLAVWAFAFLSKVCTFWFYWGARVEAGSHTDKMRSETADAEERAALVREEHKQFISATSFAVYVSNSCPQCEKVLGLLNATGSPPGVKSVDDLEPVNRSIALVMLKELAGSEVTMPMVFSQQEFLGGLFQLQEMLDKAKVESLSTKAEGEQAQRQDAPQAPEVEEDKEKEQQKQQVEDEADYRTWHCPASGIMVSI